MVGLLGGTFDPVHLGHLDVARVARRHLDLSEVWLVPSRLPPHRATPRASAAHRFAMTALAVAPDPDLRVSDLEMETSGPSYTADTLTRLVARGVDPTAVCFIVGADAFRDIQTWRAFGELLDRVHFAVVSRPGLSVAELPALLPDLAPRMVTERQAPLRSPAIMLIDDVTAAVSSTTIRQAVAEGRPLQGMVPAAVATHIARHELYAATAPEPI